MAAHALFSALGKTRPSQMAQMPKSIAIRLQLLHLLLREVADAQIRGGNAPARERRCNARQPLGQSRFPRASWPHQSVAGPGPARDNDANAYAGRPLAARGVLHP